MPNLNQTYLVLSILILSSSIRWMPLVGARPLETDSADLENVSGNSRPSVEIHDTKFAIADITPGIVKDIDVDLALVPKIKRPEIRKDIPSEILNKPRGSGVDVNAYMLEVVCADPSAWLHEQISEQRTTPSLVEFDWVLLVRLRGWQRVVEMIRDEMNTCKYCACRRPDGAGSKDSSAPFLLHPVESSPQCRAEAKPIYCMDFYKCYCSVTPRHRDVVDGEAISLRPTKEESAPARRIAIADLLNPIVEGAPENYNIPYPFSYNRRLAPGTKEPYYLEGPSSSPRKKTWDWLLNTGLGAGIGLGAPQVDKYGTGNLKRDEQTNAIRLDKPPNYPVDTVGNIISSSSSKDSPASIVRGIIHEEECSTRSI
ncbi:hypothetical protein H072_10051 [Dactylellina haptotyla CBS 200.50]|uniref:Uncharacterized protein n=1 Tax=Dactylellina haptotyla (strain CBS 200.50) TaxID=1284197 RepID=S8BMJ9_DACHA|nr:hypothetical protein H072_10051 [Dactylellina haptotyla CBS 200.50]